MIESWLCLAALEGAPGHLDLLPKLLGLSLLSTAFVLAGTLVLRPRGRSDPRRDDQGPATKATVTVDASTQALTTEERRLLGALARRIYDDMSLSELLATSKMEIATVQACLLGDPTCPGLEARGLVRLRRTPEASLKVELTRRGRAAWIDGLCST